MARTKSIRLDPAEDQVLQTLYLEKAIPTDRYVNRPTELRALTESFNRFAARSDSPEDILRYMRNRRKKKRWPTLGRRALKLHDNLGERLSDDELEVLEQVYLGIAEAADKGLDTFAHEAELMRELERRFRAATGRRIHGGDLLAALTILRKDRNLATLSRRQKAFADIDVV